MSTDFQYIFSLREYHYLISNSEDALFFIEYLGEMNFEKMKKGKESLL